MLMSRLRLHQVVVVLVLAVGAPLPARAELFVDLQEAKVLPNGTVDMPVTITGAGEAINLASFEFRAILSDGTESTFTIEEESEAYLADPDYLFVGNSAKASDGLASSVGAASTRVLPSDTFIGKDSTANGADVVVSGTKLLATLTITHNAGPGNPKDSILDAFIVFCYFGDGDSSEYLAGTNNMGFVNSAGMGVPFASMAGVVTVIPEPSTVVLATLAVAALVDRSCRRRR
jgi:hypothetical protein